MEPALVLLDSGLQDGATLAFLQQAQVTTYIHLCALTVRSPHSFNGALLSVSQILTWDWIISLAEEYRTVKKRHGPNFALLVYFLARASTMALCVLSFTFNANITGKAPLLTWDSVDIHPPSSKCSQAMIAAPDYLKELAQ